MIAALRSPRSASSSEANLLAMVSRPITENDLSPMPAISGDDEPTFMWITPSCWRYCPRGTVTPEEYSPITAATSSTVASFFAASMAALAAPAESSTMTFRSLPRTPPSSLIFATASSMPRRWSSPMEALLPVSGRTAPMLTAPSTASPPPDAGSPPPPPVVAAVPPQAVRRTARPSAAAGFRRRFGVSTEVLQLEGIACIRLCMQARMLGEYVRVDTSMSTGRRRKNRDAGGRPAGRHGDVPGS
jgi:hypothetical protein